MAHESQLSEMESRGFFGTISSFFGTLFGGDYVERRPLTLALVVVGIVLVGFILGTLFTMGVLSGLIEIDPKAIKTVFKTLMGKS